MFLLRRAASRAIAAKSSTTLLSQQRSIITAARPALVSRQQWSATPFQKRFFSAEGRRADSEEVVQAESFETEATSENAAATRNSGSISNADGNVVYVGNLFFEVTEDSLQRLFSDHGEVERVKIIYDNRGLSKGFGYVTFRSKEDAEKAIDALNQQPFQGRRLAVQPHVPRQRVNAYTEQQKTNEPSKTLFVGNMSFDMSDKDLNDLFRDVKNVVDVRVAIDRRTGQPRGFAHADMLDIESAAQAKEILSGKEIHGRRLRVDYSQSSTSGPRGDNDRPNRRYNDRGPPRERRSYD